jgi:hypothetical protein
LWIQWHCQEIVPQMVFEAEEKRTGLDTTRRAIYHWSRRSKSYPF